MSDDLDIFLSQKDKFKVYDGELPVKMDDRFIPVGWHALMLYRLELTWNGSGNEFNERVMVYTENESELKPDMNRKFVPGYYLLKNFEI